MEKDGRVIRHVHFKNGTVITIVGDIKRVGHAVNVSYGWAVCSPNEAWHRKRGINIATGRLNKNPLAYTVLDSDETKFTSETVRSLIWFADNATNNWRDSLAYLKQGEAEPPAPALTCINNVLRRNKVNADNWFTKMDHDWHKKQ